ARSAPRRAHRRAPAQRQRGNRDREPLDEAGETDRDACQSLASCLAEQPLALRVGPALPEGPGEQPADAGALARNGLVRNRLVAPHDRRTAPSRPLEEVRVLADAEDARERLTRARKEARRHERVARPRLLDGRAGRRPRTLVEPSLAQPGLDGLVVHWHYRPEDRVRSIRLRGAHEVSQPPLIDPLVVV